MSYCTFLISYNYMPQDVSPAVTVFYLSPVGLKIHCLLNDTVRITRMNQNKSEISRKAR